MKPPVTSSRLLFFAAVIGIALNHTYSQAADPRNDGTLGATPFPLLTLNGEGLRVAEFLFLKFKAYRAKLFVLEKSSDPNVLLESKSPMELSIEYLRDFDLKQTKDAWTFQYRDSEAPKYSGIEEDIKSLRESSKAIRSGDTHKFKFLDQKTEFFINQEKVTEFKRPEFRKSFLHIFLGPKPPTEDLKKGLLGK